MEDAPEKTIEPPRLTRRQFLKLLGVGSAALATPGVIEVGLSGLETLAGKYDRLAEIAVLSDVRRGKFAPERIGRIRNLEELTNTILKEIRSLRGVDESSVEIADGTRMEHVRSGNAPEHFFPASTIKVPICYEAWKMGQRDGKDYLTPELADQILRRSFTFRDLVLNLPIAGARTSAQLEAIVRDILTEAKLPPLNRQGELPLRVEMDRFFRYLRSLEMPEVMATALLQRREDESRNYGVSTVLLDNLKQKFPAYFKLGLLPDPTNPDSLVNSYFIQIGSDVKALGYACGEDRVDVHTQMLYTAACLASYAVNS